MPDDMLLVQYRGAELKLPTGVGCGCSCCAVSVSSVAMIDPGKVRNYYIACGYTDLRYGIDGLAAAVTRRAERHGRSDF